MDEQAKRTLLKSLGPAPGQPASARAVLVTVDAVQGSAPREVGAWMAVLPSTDIVGSVGGGQLEWQAWQQAGQWLQAGLQAPTLEKPVRMRYALGPSLGQCCGGQVQLRFEVITGADVPALQARWASACKAWPTVALFGAGHVGHALVHVLQRLPVRVHWIDSRDGAFAGLAPNPHTDTFVHTEHSAPVQAAVPHLPAGSLVLIMSFSHAEDWELVLACLQRQRERGDLAFIGLIGSRSKWASFSRRLLERGFTQAHINAVTCPIGLPGIAGKHPDVIAVSVAAQLLQVLSAAAPA